MKRFLLFVFLLFSIENLLAQQIVFRVQLQGEDLELGEDYSLDKQSFTISTCKFYVSNLQFNGESLNNSYHLIDIANKESLTIALPVIQKKGNATFKCTLGVDSTKSVSGVFGDDLDPTNGMYWTWQSGYINAKIEGLSPTCPARKNKFQFHLGGYAYPYNTSRKVSLKLKKEGDNYIVLINLDYFFEEVDLSKSYQVMSPNTSAMKLSDIFAECFSANEK